MNLVRQGKAKINRKIVTIALLVSVIIILVIMTSQNFNDYSEPLITRDVSDMLPVISQSPLTNKINETTAERSYQFYFQHDPMVLKYEIVKYSSLEDAAENYLSTKNKYSELSVINLGNDGFGTEVERQYSLVVFRTLNVVTKVELDGNQTNLGRTITYAKMVRI